MSFSASHYEQTIVPSEVLYEVVMTQDSTLLHKGVFTTSNTLEKAKTELAYLLENVPEVKPILVRVTIYREVIGE